MTYLFVCNQGSLLSHCMQDYKCLCTAVTICATLFIPKIDLSILTPLTSESRSNPRDLLQLCQVHPRSKFGDRKSASCRDNADISIFMMTQKPSKVGQGDLVSVSHQGALVSLRTEDYKSLCTAVIIRATMVVSKCFVHFDPCNPEK